MADDDTVPTGRAGVDPLIAYPAEPTGQTGEIERPGQHTPWWFIPGLCAVALLFVGMLLVVDDRNDDRNARFAEPAVVSTANSSLTSMPSSDPDPATTESIDAGTTPSPVDPAGGDTVPVDLPAPGNVRIGSQDFMIITACEVQVPFDPVDTDYQVSSYLFVDPSGVRNVIERVSDGGETSVAWYAGGSRRASRSFSNIGDAGAFSASFDASVDGAGGGPDAETVTATVDPDVASRPCSDQIVTNAPGQFAEPTMQVVLSVCVTESSDDRPTIVGWASQGVRFEILPIDAETADVEVDLGPSAAERYRTTEPATLLRTDGYVSLSGRMSDGAGDLDLTIDLGLDVSDVGAATCADGDRLAP